MKIIYDEEHILELDLLDMMKQAADICIADESLDSELCEVSLSIVSPEEIKFLNKEYRGNDSVTDVLSFPQYYDLSDIENEEEICLGDVVINDEAVRSQAEEYGHSYERELIYLFVHSILHLLGYDHMEAEDKEEMRSFEEKVMSKLRLER